MRLQHCTLAEALATDAEVFRLVEIERLSRREDAEGGEEWPGTP